MSLGEQLLGVIYNRGAPLAQRVAAARAWVEVRRVSPGDVDERHAGEVAGLLVGTMGSALPERLDPWDEPTPPAGWSPPEAA